MLFCKLLKLDCLNPPLSTLEIISEAKRGISGGGGVAELFKHGSNLPMIRQYDRQFLAFLMTSFRFPTCLLGD